MGTRRGSAQAEELADVLEVRAVEDGELGEVALLLLGLLRQDVAVESVLSLDLPCSGKSESFFGTGISFNLRHFKNNYTVILNVGAFCALRKFVLFLFWSKHDDHSFAFEEGHLLHFAVVFEVVGKS